LTLESTSAVGSSDFISFKTGSQVERWRIDTSGSLIGVNTLNTGPLISVYANATTPALNDAVGQIVFFGNNSISTKKTYGIIAHDIFTPTNGAEGSYYAFQFMYNGTLRADGVLFGYHSGASLEYVYHWYDNAAPFFYLESTHAGGGLQQVFWNDASTQAANDVLGTVAFDGRLASGGAYQQYAAITGYVIATGAASANAKGGVRVQTANAGTLAEALRVDDQGQVTVGGFANTFGSRLEVVADPTLFVHEDLIGFGANNSGPALFFLKTRNASPTGQTAVSSGDSLGGNVFEGSDGTLFRTAASATAAAEGSISSGIVPGRFAVKTANSSGTNTEALRIDSKQFLYVGSPGNQPSTTNAGVVFATNGLNNFNLSLWAFGGAGANASLEAYSTRSATLTGHTAVVSGDQLFSFAGNGDDGTNYSTGSAFSFEVDGTVTTGHVPGRTVFQTSSATTLNVEAMRIDSVQAITFGPSGAKTAGITAAGVLSATLSAASGTSTVCNTAGTRTNLTLVASGTACGSSAIRFKEILPAQALNLAGLADLRTDNPWSYRKDSGLYQNGLVQVGLFADDVERMDKRCVVYDGEGRLLNYYDRCILAYLVAEVNQLRAELHK
jgi:hypothetical protein